MKVTFLGTRGNIPIRSPAHRMHSSLLVSNGRGDVLIDCGADWLGRLDQWHPAAIFITHAHSDHAAGLRHGTKCAVYATPETWQRMARWPVMDRGVLPLRHAIQVSGLQIEAWPVDHSTNAPAVGYRVSARGVNLFYVPDVAKLRDPSHALNRIDLYIGDGACVDRSLVRPRGSVLIGHARVRTQLEWCETAGVHRAIFTHCGSAVVRSDPRTIETKIRAIARAGEIDARIAYDGMSLVLRRRARR